MGIVNSKSSGLYSFIQPLKAPNGSTVVGGAVAPQQLIMANSKVTFENSPIDTTHTIHPVTFNTPTYPGTVIGTTYLNPYKEGRSLKKNSSEQNKKVCK